MKTQRNLRELGRGERGWVAAVAADGPLSRRLLDLGLVPGTAVKCLGSAPAGDPTAYAFRGAVIALRGRDAETVALAEEQPCPAR